MLKSIIFDCDGVLLDTLEANRAFYDAILERLGYPSLNDADLHIVHAMTVLEAFAHVLSPNDALKAPVVAGQIDRAVYLSRVKVPEHTHELLQKLKGRFMLGIVTNRDARGIRLLDDFGLLDFFQAVVTSSDVVKPKPAPEGLLKACDLLGVAPGEALYVGDSPSDMRAANDAGVKFAAYGQGLNIACRAGNMRELELLIDNLGLAKPKI